MPFIPHSEADIRDMLASIGAKNIDALFANSMFETQTQSEKDWLRAQIAQIGDMGFFVNSIIAAVMFALQVQGLVPARVPAFQRYSKFPSIRRDLAIVVADDVSAEALTRTARAVAGEILRDVVVFDIYRGKGVDSRRKSVGLGLILQDESRTLTDEDADRKMRAVMLSLEREFGATIRT